MVVVPATGKLERGNFAFLLGHQFIDGLVLMTHFGLDPVFCVQEGLPCLSGLPQFVADVQFLVGFHSLVNLSLLHHLEDTLLLVRHLAEVDAGKSVNVIVKVRQLILVKELQGVASPVEFLLLQFAFCFQSFKLAHRPFVFCLVSFGGGFGKVLLSHGEVLAVHHHQFEYRLVARDEPLSHRIGVHYLEARLSGTHQVHFVARFQGAEVQNKAPIFGRHLAPRIAHSHLYTSQWRLRKLLVILLHDAWLCRLSQHT